MLYRESLRTIFKRFNTKRVKANDVYQDYIRDKHIDETYEGWFIAWIDYSLKALENQEASLTGKEEREGR